jgi:hypothetical protein
MFVARHYAANYRHGDINALLVSNAPLGRINTSSLTVRPYVRPLLRPQQENYDREPRIIGVCAVLSFSSSFVAG